MTCADCPPQFDATHCYSAEEFGEACEVCLTNLSFGISRKWCSRFKQWWHFTPHGRCEQLHDPWQEKPAISWQLDAEGRPVGIVRHGVFDFVTVWP